MYVCTYEQFFAMHEFDTSANLFEFYIDIMISNL